MFDSGFGGLTVARALIDLLPTEDLVYLGDTARYPYGSRSMAEVARYSRQIARHLVERHDVKFLVVACNTASAAALDELAEVVEVPVVGVIDPGVRALRSATLTGRVGVIGTVGTISSGAYQRSLEGLAGEPGCAPATELAAVACPGFVEFVERGDFDGVEVHVLAQRLLAPVAEAKVDTLLLGCTHYPYLARTITDVLGPDVMLVSSADETAFEVRRLIGELGIGASGAGPGLHRFETTGDVNRFEQLGRELLGPELSSAAQVELR